MVTDGGDVERNAANLECFAFYGKYAVTDAQLYQRTDFRSRAPPLPLPTLWQPSRTSLEVLFSHKGRAVNKEYRGTGPRKLKWRWDSTDANDGGVALLLLQNLTPSRQGCYRESGVLAYRYEPLGHSAEQNERVRGRLAL